MKNSKKKREERFLEKLFFEHTRNEDTEVEERTGVNVLSLYLLLEIVAIVIFGIGKFMS